MESQEFPKSLLQAVRYFDSLDVCVEFVAAMRWPDGPVCPHCESKRHSFLSTRRIWKCKDCRKQFSVKSGAIFEDSPIALDKWLTAIWLVVNCKNGISSYEIARDLKITQKSAWFMLQRIRLALQNGSWSKLGGGGAPVEVDETHVGPKPQKMHRDKRLKMQSGLHANKKMVVMGMLDRESRQVRAKVVPDVKRETLQNEILSQIEHGSKVYTDGFPGYHNLKAQEYIHETRQPCGRVCAGLKNSQR